MSSIMLSVKDKLKTSGCTPLGLAELSEPPSGMPDFGMPNTGISNNFWGVVPVFWGWLLSFGCSNDAGDVQHCFAIFE